MRGIYKLSGQGAIVVIFDRRMSVDDIRSAEEDLTKRFGTKVIVLDGSVRDVFRLDE